MVETTALNPRAVPGSNEAPDYAQQVTDRLAREYEAVKTTLDDLVAEAAALPPLVDTDDEALKRGALIKRLRDVDTRIEGVRVLEKEPYLRGGNAVDALLNGWRDLIGKRNKNDRTAKAGAIDNLQAGINAHQDRKIAAERIRLENERRETERLAMEARRLAEQEAAALEAKRLAEERARKPENKMAHRAAAEAQEGVSFEASSSAARATELAEEARLASLARPADIARVRGNAESGAGVTLTVAKEPYAILTDRALVNLELLRPYFTDAEIEKALRGWAKATGHRIAMPGADIGHRNRGVTR